MVNKWRVGQRVRVKSREEIDATLDSNHETSGIYFPDRMYNFCGKIITISKVRSYGVGSSGWDWASEWIRPVTKIKVNTRRGRDV